MNQKIYVIHFSKARDKLDCMRKEAENNEAF